MHHKRKQCFSRRASHQVCIELSPLVRACERCCGSTLSPGLRSASAVPVYRLLWQKKELGRTDVFRKGYRCSEIWECIRIHNVINSKARDGFNCGESLSE